MRTKKYKTLEGFFRANNIRELEFRDFLYREIYGSKGLIRFSLSDEAFIRACDMFASAIVSKRSVKRYSFLIQMYKGKSYGIFHRLSIYKGRNGLFGKYCAGQDYDSEVRAVRNIFRNG